MLCQTHILMFSWYCLVSEGWLYRGWSSRGREKKKQMKHTGHTRYMNAIWIHELDYYPFFNALSPNRRINEYLINSIKITWPNSMQLKWVLLFSVTSSKISRWQMIKIRVIYFLKICSAYTLALTWHNFILFFLLLWHPFISPWPCKTMWAGEQKKAKLFKNNQNLYSPVPLWVPVPPVSYEPPLPFSGRRRQAEVVHKPTTCTSAITTATQRTSSLDH